MNPIEERDTTINQQQEKIEDLLAQQKENSNPKEQVLKISMENDLLKNSNKKFQKKLNFAQRITEQKILENISEESYREDPHLVTVLSTTLDEDNLDLDNRDDDDESPTVSPSSGTVRSRKEKFLESLEHKLDKENHIQQERLQHLKLKVINHLKVTKERGARSRTNSKRKSSEDDDDKESSCPRTASPTL